MHVYKTLRGWAMVEACSKYMSTQAHENIYRIAGSFGEFGKCRQIKNSPIYVDYCKCAYGAKNTDRQI